jgi:AGZA family xanthine/uracil permease-like MFS transporter
VTQGAFLAADGTAVQALIGDTPATSQAASNGFLLHGMIVLERGYIFTCMILAAVSAFLIDRRFASAAGWSLAAAALTALGLMHAYQLAGNAPDYLFAFQRPAETATAYRAWGVAAGYAAFAALFAAAGFWFARGREEGRPSETRETGPGY